MSAPVSLAICSNRPPQLLGQVLDRLAAGDAPGDMPLLWVDNTPQTPCQEEIRALLAQRPRTCYLSVPTPGLSHARNVAMNACQTPWLAFLDDDALPGTSWCQNLRSLLEQTPLQVAMLGGPVLPVWPLPPPAWLGASLSQLLALVNWSPAPALLRPRQWIAGTNMILRTDALRQAGGFPVHLGRQGQNLLSMEELALGHTLEQLGYERFFHPELEVEHVLQAGRLRCGWFWKRSWWQGVSEVLAPTLPSEPHPRPYHLLPPPGLKTRSLPDALMRLSCLLLRLLGHLSASLSRKGS